MKTKILLVAALMPIIAKAQNAYEYAGERVALESHYFQSSNFAKLSGDKKLTYQGMDICDNIMVSAQNTGVVTIYKIERSELDKQKQFKLASYGKDNHANALSFGVEKVSAENKLPVVYVSQCNKNTENAAFVEQIENNFKSSKLVQTITLKEGGSNPLEWVVDRENEVIYAYMSTEKWNAKGKHKLMKFRLPKLSEGEKIELTSADALDTYCIEDSYQGPFSSVAQGLYIHEGLLFIPAGDGAKNASVLYVWDLGARVMRNVIDLSVATRGELEDCSVYDGHLYVQTQGNMYKLAF